jgi:hydrogenase/urease accessory protein HupE
MSRVFRRLLIALTFAVCSVSVTSAHPAPFSYLDVVFKDGGIEGTLVVHVIDVAHELSVQPEQVMDAAFATAQQHRIGEILASRLELRGDERLSIEWRGLEVMKEEQALRLRYRIPNVDFGALTIDTNLFPYDPLHQTFINVYEEGALRQQVIFNNETNAHVYYRGTTQGAIEVMKVFIPSGTHHILIGPDHILFLIGLLLLGGSWGALVRIVTAFTIGHSITLSLAALNIVTPPASIIEPAIALSIVFVGADNLVRGDGRDLRAWVALVFGLVHGFGFANVLREFGLPREALGWSLFSFNFGVEIGQLMVVLLVASLLAAIRQRNQLLGSRVAFAGSVVVIAAGTYWFVQRVFFPVGA